MFNVSINGTQVLSNFDIFADSGAEYKADDKVFNNISPSNGQITIQFGPASADNAQVCAIQIIPQPATPTNTLTSTNTFTYTPTNTLTSTNTLTYTATNTLTSTNTFTKTNTPVPPTNTFTNTYTATNTFTSTNTFTKTNTPVTPSATPTTPVPTNTPITPSATPTTPVPTNTPITPSATPTTPVPTSTPITPSATPTTPVPTNTPITPSATPTTPVPTNTPITPSATPTTPVPTNTPITPSPTVPTTVNLTIELRSADTNNNSNSPHPQFQIVNSGTSAINLNNIEVRYWFNCDCTGQAIQAWVDWAGLLPAGTSVTQDVQTTVVPTTLGGQTDYISYKFTGNLVLQPGQTIEIQARFNKSDWSAMVQSNDWSYSNTQSWQAWTRVTAYSSGVLVWGQEPSSTQSTAVVSNVMTYPNPATAATGVNIKYTVNTTSTGAAAAALGQRVYVPSPDTTVYLKVYTVSGRLIWQQELTGVYYVSTGDHTVQWSGKASGGQTLAPGAYRLKVEMKGQGISSAGFSTILILK